MGEHSDSITLSAVSMKLSVFSVSFSGSKGPKVLSIKIAFGKVAGTPSSVA